MSMINQFQAARSWSFKLKEFRAQGARLKFYGFRVFGLSVGCTVYGTWS